jgi:hypothetical protein
VARERGQGGRAVDWHGGHDTAAPCRRDRRSVPENPPMTFADVMLLVIAFTLILLLATVKRGCNQIIKGLQALYDRQR